MRHVFWLIPDVLAGRPGPDRESWSLEEIRLCGIGAVLSVNDGLLCHPEDFASVGMLYRCFPLPPNAPPQPGDLEHCRRVLPSAFDFVEDMRRSGKPTLVHCTSGGCVLIGHFDWFPLPGSVVEATEALIRKHNPEWWMGGGTGVYPAWFGDLAGAGFVGLDSLSFDLDQPYSHEAWRGRIRASAGIAASLSADAVARFDEDHAALLGERFPEQPLRVPHRVFAIVGRKVPR